MTSTSKAGREAVLNGRARRGAGRGWRRRTFLKSSAGLAMAAGAWASPGLRASVSGSGDVPLIELSARQLAEKIRRREVTARAAVEAYLDRIEEVNPKINAVVTLCADRARLEARRADEALAAGKVMGPLHGVPFTIKDSLETAGVVSTSGTLGRALYVPEKDATVVGRLRAAGAILLGKSNTPEFTMGGGSRGTANLLFGQTYNPYNLAHSPAGSSGGAGAIVAACGAAFDIGSDLGGSVRGPCHANGIAGIKPTSGRTPRTGHVPGYGGLFDSWQQLGPMARRMEDIELLMPIICGEDLEDAFCYDIPMGDPGKVAVGRLRVAYYTDNGVMAPIPEIRRLVRDAAGWMGEAGAWVQEDIHPNYVEDHELFTQVREAEGGAWQERLLKRYGTAVADPGLRARISGKYAATPDFIRMMEEVDLARSRMLQWMRNYDVVLCPVSPYAAARLDNPPPRNVNYTRHYNVSGWPAAVVRAGTSPEGLPLGIQVVAAPWRDDVAMAVARFIEDRTGGWQKPNL